MPLVVCEESPDEGGQRGGSEVGLEDVLGGRDRHCGGRRGVVGWGCRVEGLYTIFFSFLFGMQLSQKCDRIWTEIGHGQAHLCVTSPLVIASVHVAVFELPLLGRRPA